MSDLPTLKLRLAEAELALHKLVMGEKVVMLSYAAEGNHQRQFHQTSIPQLKIYVAELKDQIARAEGRGGRRPFYLA